MNLAIALHTAGRVSSTPDEFHTIAKGGIHCSRRQIVGQRGCLPATVIGQSHVLCSGYPQLYYEQNRGVSIQSAMFEIFEIFSDEYQTLQILWCRVLLLLVCSLSPDVFW